MKIEGSTVLVTGASSGIGAALAPQLAERGAIVGIVARRADRLEEVLEQCRRHTPESRMWSADLGDLERAEAVKRYLYEQHQIPLHKMNAISYGEDKPAAENKTRAGRAQNRRVVIKVLA